MRTWRISIKIYFTHSTHKVFTVHIQILGCCSWATEMGFSSVQLLSRVWLFATPWIAACQASLTHPVCGHLLWQPRKLICLMRASVSEKPHCDLFWVIFPSLDMSSGPRLGAVVLGLTQVTWLALWWETHIPGSGGGKEGVGTDRKTESSTVIIIYFFTISHWNFEGASENAVLQSIFTNVLQRKEKCRTAAD